MSATVSSAYFSSLKFSRSLYSPDVVAKTLNVNRRLFFLHRWISKCIKTFWVAAAETGPLFSVSLEVSISYLSSDGYFAMVWTYYTTNVLRLSFRLTLYPSWPEFIPSHLMLSSVPLKAVIIVVDASCHFGIWGHHISFSVILWSNHGCFCSPVNC